MKFANHHFIFISGFANDSSVFLPLIETMGIEVNQYQLVNLPNVKVLENKKNRQTLFDYLKGFENQISKLACHQNIILIASSLAGMLILKLLETNKLSFTTGVILLGVNLSFIQRNNWQYAMQASIFNQFKGSLNQSDKNRISYTSHQRFCNLELWGDEFDEEISKRNARQILAEANNLDYQSLQVLLEFLSRLNLIEGIKTIKKPIQFIFGQNDALVPISAKSAIKKLTTHQLNITTDAIKNSGHLPMLTHPKKCKEIIKSFLENKVE